MGNDGAKDLHHVHAVVDEMTNLQLSADLFFVFPLQAEPHMVLLQASAREEIDRLQPGQGSLLHAWACLRDDPHPPITG
jgi:hypothetical protein